MTDMTRRTVLAGTAVLPVLPAQGAAMAHETMLLWPGLPPGAPSILPPRRQEKRGAPPRAEQWLTSVDRPTLEVYRPAAGNGIGVLVIPGGGYEFLAIENEGWRVAERLARDGFTAFVLTYRLPAQGWTKQADVPLQDAQRAMRVIRAQSLRFGIDPARVGVVGFSAGGHLAATLATGFDERLYPPVDAQDALSARPSWAGIIYAVTTLELPDTHRGSREHLLGKSVSEAEVQRRSPLLHLDGRTPPCFVLHAFDDGVVPAACGLRWMEACRREQVGVEAYFPARGGHGFGVGLPDVQPAATWIAAFTRWAKATSGAGV